MAKDKGKKGKSDKGKADKGTSTARRSGRSKSGNGKSGNGKSGNGKSANGKSEHGKSGHGKSGHGKSARTSADDPAKQPSAPSQAITVRQRDELTVGPERELAIGIVQCPLPGPREENVERVVGLIREAARQGAKIIITPELMEGPYFCRVQDEAYFREARPVEGNATLERFQALARELDVVLPYSWFEHTGQAYFNSVAVVDAGGALLGVYRKTHIPDGPGYMEKYYFRPGLGAPRVFPTRYGRLGVAICWDQWYPECARAMALEGAEMLAYPTAIGSEPKSGEDTKDPWQRAMIGHAVSNSMPVAAANRIGHEGTLDFYGASFIANPRGDKVAELGKGETGVAVARFDRKKLEERRASWGFFRDRRPDLYGRLLQP
ncbi:MAG: nitrilase-related carbon-nitrogen hydrolase [Sandaracinaceae bacterium]